MNHTCVNTAPNPTALMQPCEACQVEMRDNPSRWLAIHYPEAAIKLCVETLLALTPEQRAQVLAELPETKLNRRTRGIRLEFLELRRLYIHEMLAEGDSPERIASALSMDPGQVRLIGATDSPLKTAAARVALLVRAIEAEAKAGGAES